jgi:hypothetical protein
MAFLQPLYVGSIALDSKQYANMPDALLNILKKKEN